MTVGLEHHRCFLLFLECFGGILLKKRIATKHHDFDVSPRVNTFFSLIHQYYLRMPSTVTLLQKDIQPLSALFFLLLHGLVLHLTLFSKRSHWLVPCFLIRSLNSSQSDYFLSICSFDSSYSNQFFSLLLFILFELQHEFYYYLQRWLTLRLMDFSELSPFSEYSAWSFHLQCNLLLDQKLSYLFSSLSEVIQARLLFFSLAFQYFLLAITLEYV